MNHQGHAPLAVFTSLAIAGAGLAAALPVLDRTTPEAVQTAALAAGVALQAVALLVSLAHLGRKTRAPLAASRIGASALSNEIVMAGAALVASGVLLVAGWHAPAPAWLRELTAALCVGFLVAIGLVYRIPGQLTWTGPAALTPLTSGLAFGAAVLAAFAGTTDGVPRTGVALIGIDAAVFLLRWQEAAAIDHAADGGSAGPLWRQRHQWFFARFVLLDVATLALLLFFPTRFAAAAASAGLLTDRIAFYGTAAQHSTEREVDRVERIIQDRG